MTPRELLESFVLIDEEKRARALPADARETARALIAHADLDRSTANERWIGSRPADALRLLESACREADDAAAQIGQSVEPIPETTTEPARYDALLTHYDLVRTNVSNLTDSRAVRFARRFGRLMIPLSIVLLALFVRRVRKFVHPVASGSFSPKYDARYAVDGRGDTAWIAPDSTNATIDFELMPPRPVLYVRMLDTRNAPNNDREVKEFRLEFWREGRPIDAVEGSFPGGDKPGFIRVVVNRDWPVEKVRFVIKSFAQKGGGLAEIEFH